MMTKAQNTMAGECSILSKHSWYQLSFDGRPVKLTEQLAEESERLIFWFGKMLKYLLKAAVIEALTGRTILHLYTVHHQGRVDGYEQQKYGIDQQIGQMHIFAIGIPFHLQVFLTQRMGEKFDTSMIYHSLREE